MVTKEIPGRWRPSLDGVNEGRAWVLGDDVSTDDIVPGRFLEIREVDVLARHVFHDLVPGFHAAVQPGDVIVAGKTFGSGSSREQAPALLARLGIGCIYAESFARIFFRNAVNIGLPVFTIPEGTKAFFSTGDAVRYVIETPRLDNMSRPASVALAPYPQFFLRMLRAGGALALLRTTGP